MPIYAYSPLAIVAWVLAFPYFQLARGRIHPQATIDRMVAEHTRVVEDIAHDRDEWRAAHRISETARQVAADQVDELLEHAKTTDAFIKAIPAAAGGA